MDAEQGSVTWANARSRDTILLVGPRRVTWEGVTSIIRRNHAFAVVGDLSCADEALEKASERRPAFIVLALDLSGIDNIEFTTKLSVRSPLSKLIVLGDEIDHELLLMLGRVPIDGYLLWKDLEPAVIDVALQALRLGLRIGSASAVDELLARQEDQHHLRLDAAHITSLEREVIRGLAAGYTEKEIARQVARSRTTVARIIERLEVRLGAGNRWELAVAVTRIGLEC